VEDGYEFFGDKELVIVFSGSNYMREFDNSGAIRLVDDNLTCSVKIIKGGRK
jgi:serine/threonine-protein phosphatase PP1 catalytic subunit